MSENNADAAAQRRREQLARAAHLIGEDPHEGFLDDDYWDDQSTERPKGRRIAPSVRRLVFARDGNRCWYCGTAVQPGKGAEIDHVQPVTKGGTDDPANLVAACISCNRRKKDRTLEEYRTALQYVWNAPARAAVLLEAALQEHPTPYDDSVRAAVEWLREQLPPVVFWGERR